MILFKYSSISAQTFKLFRDGEKLTDVAIALEIPGRKALRLWSRFLILEKCYIKVIIYLVFRILLLELILNEIELRNKMKVTIRKKSYLI